MKKLYILIVYFISSLIYAGTPGIIFKENKGQWTEKVLFGTEFYNVKFYVNRNSFNYCVYSLEDLKKNNEHHGDHSENTIIHGHNYEVEFSGADLSNFTKTNEQPEYYNYFLGNVRSKWASRVKAYAGIEFQNIYNGVNLKLYSNSINLKYDLIVKPNANSNSIKLNYKYLNGIALRNNDLIITTSVGEIIEQKPFAYQIIDGKKKEVKCFYTLLENNSVGFVFPESYNKNYELVIDPTVIVCSYSNAHAQSDASSCTYDANGNIYSFGYGIAGYPTTVGAFQMNPGGYFDFILSVYNTTGSSKLYSTYLGGDSLDFPIDITVKNNEITLFGQTISKDFPTTLTAFDTTYNGNYDFIISKLNMAGTTLLASTYIGGVGRECLNNLASATLDFGLGEMVCDTSGNVYVVSATTSTNFPVSSSAISSTRKGFTDACAFKLDKKLSNLIWSTYIGGTQDENGRGIRLDGSGGVYICGTTTSTNFPVTSGVIQTVKSGFASAGDIYISHINASGNSFIASTYLGTQTFDYGRHIDLDHNNDIYVFSHLQSPTTFTSSPAGIYNNTNGYNAIYKVNSSLTNVIYKTKFGNYINGVTPYFISTAFKVDSCQNIYIGGYGENSFYITPNAFQSGFGGGKTDMYYTVFSSNCTSLKFASYWGGRNTLNFNNIGEHSDGGLSHFDNRGYLYQSICNTGNLPTTPNAFNRIKLDDSTCYNESFIKIDFQTFINAGSSYGANITGCPPFTTHFVSTSNTGTSYWNLGDGTTTHSDTITHTYNNLGTYNVTLVVTDTNTCNRIDSIKSILNVINPTPFDIGEDIQICANTKVLINSNVTAVTYSWSTGQTTPNIYALPGTYTLTINNGGCNSSDVVNVVIGEKKLSERFPNVVTANGDNINDFIDLKKYNFQEVELFIYDRWGREVIKITDPDSEWHPDNLHAGTYYYVANYLSSCVGKYNTDKGFISVFK